MAVLWNKRRMAGDLLLRFWAGPKMLDPVQGRENERFSEMNVTICADGERLGSGYSFIVGGWGNTKSALLREGQVVAESTDFHFPPQKVGHQRWFLIQVERRGGHLSLQVDGTPVLSYEDPNPLCGDRVAFWTQDNGMMVGRADMWCDREKEAPLVLRSVPAPASPAAPASSAEPQDAEEVSIPLCNGFEDGVAQWAGTSAQLRIDETTAAHGTRSLVLENRESGGDFKAVAFQGGLDATTAPLIAFDYRVPPYVRVNLYVRVRKSYYTIQLTGPPGAEADQDADTPGDEVNVALGKIAGVQADGAWHHATFDLLAKLKEHFAGPVPRVKEILFGNLDTSDPYLRAGVTGNSLGCRYWIDEFSLGPYQDGK